VGSLPGRGVARVFRGGRKPLLFRGKMCSKGRAPSSKGKNNNFAFPLQKKTLLLKVSGGKATSTQGQQAMLKKDYYLCK